MAEDITLDSLEEFPQTEEENTYEVEALVSEGETESIPDVVVVTSDISDTVSETTDQTDTTNETVITPDDSIVDFGVVPEEPDNTENQSFPIKKRTSYYTESVVLSDYSVEGLEKYISNSEWKVYAIFNDNTEREVTWDEVYDPASTSTLYNIVEAAQIAHVNNQHYWNNDNGVHITDDTLEAWVTEWDKANHGTLDTPTAQKPWHNILMNSVGIILRTGTKFLSSWSKSGVAFYDGTGNSASNVIASYGSNGAQIGKSSEKHAVIDSSGLTVYDENGDIAPVFASNIAADHAKIGELIADTADIGEIRANSAKVKDVTAQAITAATGYIAALTAGEIAASDLIADHASIDTLETNTADIATIRANSAKVNDVTAQAITAATGYIATLTSKNITANDMAAAHANVGVLLANTADIATIRANSAKVKDVTAEAITAATGYIADLNSKNITANDISADHASIDTLEANTADIDTIRANSAKVKDVTAQAITAATGYIAALNSKNITANDISADHASIDTLEANTADIDTIRANSAKVKDVTAQAITAATGYIAALTAGEIAASDLIADHASIDTLETKTADIETIRANSAKVNNVTAQAITAATGYIAALTAESIAASDLIADHGEIASLETNYAHITNGVINNAKIGHADVNGLNANYAHVTNGVIDNADINHADVVGLNANYAHVTNGVIDSAKIDQANVNNLRTNYAHVTNGVIDESWINHASVVGLDINYAHIENGVINNAKIDQADVNNLDANYAHITDGVIDNATIDQADVNDLDANYAHITDGVIDNATIDQADVNDLDANYAHISNGVIDNAKIDHADVNDLGANYAHITNGVIDQANISHANVTGLSANYAHMVNGVIDNAKIDQAKVNNLRTNYAHITNGVIDNADINHADVVGLNTNYAHITNGVIDNADINHADVVGLDANFAHITNGIIDNAEIDYADVNDLDAHYAHITNGVIDNADIGYADVVGLNANYAHITNGVIDNAEIDQADVNNLDANYAHITDGAIDNATIDQAYVTDLETHYASIANGVINNAAIDQADVNNLDTHYAHITNGVIDNADIGYADVVGLNANYAHITNGVIDNADINYADVNDLEAHYAQIDMANVSNGWITNGVIKNGAIKNGMIESVTASKLTAGTINADNVAITNLKAENIKVSKINGVNVTGKTVKDALEQHEDDISDLDSKIDDAIEDLNDRIDAQIETWTTDTIPLLSNYPASSWNTNDLKAEHVGDICYVVNAVSDADGYTYRFAYDNTTSSYKWVLIKDNQVTAALGRINDLETFESNTSTWIDETDEGLTTIRENHTALSGRVDKTLISTTQLWFTKANTTAPNAPSAHVTVNNPATANAWNIAVPTYNASYPNYYYCYEWQYADNTYGWSAVTRDIATGEMQATSRSAQNTANSAIKSSIQLWYIKANDTAPSKPTKTSDVVSNAATANKWNTLVPTYNNSYPYYFYCWQYQKADNTYVWSDVAYDRATTENQANSRNAQATLATKVDSSTFSELVETVDEHSNAITSLSTVSETLIKESIEYIVGTQTAVTGSWTGVTREAALYNGKTIAYRLPYAGSGNASLNLTLAGGGTTGAKAVYINNTRVTTHYPANSIITLTYNGTDWRASAYWDGNTYDRTRYSVYIKIITAATRTWQMFVGNNDGYRRLVAGISYDLSYPLLVFSDTPAAGETKNTGYLCVSGYIYNIYVGTTVQSAAVNKLVYLKGTVNGTIFTVASSNFLTCAVPTTEDNFFYIPLGVITVVDSTNTTGYFQTNDQLWAYVDGKFQQANPMVKTTNTVVNEVKQTADTNTASIRGLTTITDNLSLFNNGHPGYWRIDRYKKPSRFTSSAIIPEYSDFSDVNFIETVYKTDEEFNVNWNIDSNYLAKIYTYVHTTEDVTITGYRFAHDDSCVLYVNNEEIGKSGSTTPFAVEFTLTSGWNKIEALLYENTGSDYVRFIEAETTTAVSILSFTGVDRIQADLPVFDSETTEHKISEIVQTLDGFQTTVSNTYATKNSFDVLQDSFNNLEIGGRNLLKNTSLPMTKTVTIGDSGWTAVHFYEMVKPYINFFKLNDELTISFNWETNNTTGGNWHLECGQTSPYTWGTVVKAIGTRSATSNYVDISSNNYSGYVAITCKATQTHINNGALLKYLKIRWDGTDWNGKTFTISNAKVEKGNKVTDWTPAPEDIDETTNNIITNLDTEIKQRKALYATCYTGAAAQDKIGTCADFVIYSGVKISVRFINGNSHVLPTLNINGTGAFNIKSYSGASLSIDNKEYEWIGNSIHEFIYDGTNWRLIDSGITSRITQAETKIDQNTEAITLRATKTEAIQIAQPNLSPILSYDPYPTDSVNPSGYIDDEQAGTVGSYWKYWSPNTVGYITRLSDGWAHYDYNNTGSSTLRVECAVEKSPEVKPGTLYTILVECRNISLELTNDSAIVDFYLVQSTNCQFWGGSVYSMLENIGTTGADTNTTIRFNLKDNSDYICKRFTKYSEAVGSTHLTNGDWAKAYKLMAYTCNVAAGAHITFDARISIYEGEYWGVYKPYVGKQLYSTQAELKVANDAISTKVETNGVISAINQSAEQITIDANRVNIAGAAIFTTGALKKVVTSAQNEWYSSTSASSLTGGSWATTQPSVAAGRFIWTREKLTYSDGTSEYKPSQNGVCTQGQTNLSNYYTKTQVDDVTNTLAPKSSAATKTQRIWYRTTTTKTLTGPTTWVTANGNVYNDWTTKCPPLASNLNSGGTKYPYLYTCVQTQTVAQAANNGTSCTCSAVLLDDSTTVIDGGKLITGSVAANKIDATDINASGMLTVGALSQATQNDILTQGKANILPYFSIDPNDQNYWNTLENANTSRNNTEGHEECYIEPDGWAHYIFDSRAEAGNIGKTSYQNICLTVNAIVPYLKPSTEYTLMLEVKDFIGDAVTYRLCNATEGMNAFNSVSKVITGNGIYYITQTTISDFSNLTRGTRGYVAVAQDRQADLRIRVSLYEGYYSGPYKPYIGKLLYPTNTDLATTNLTLSGAVVDTQTIYIQAVSGTNAIAKKTDAWVTIATESTVSDTTGLTPAWTTKRPTYRSNYPVIFIAQQTKLIDGTIVCSTPVKDDTLTIIDGGHITTGTIDASKVNVTNLDASKITTGKVQASQINSTNLHVSAANVDGKLTANQINASGLSIGYSQLTNVPSIPSKVTDLSDGSSYAKTSEVVAAIDDISVGGRNLLFNTSDKWMGPYLLAVNANNVATYPYYSDDVSWIAPGRYVTLTFEIEVNMVAGTGGTPHMYPQIHFARADDTSSWANRTNTSFSTILTDFTRQVGSNEFVVGNNIYRYSYTGVINETAANIEGAKGIRLGVRADYVGTNTYIKFRNVKLELGNKATAWSPAPEDLAKPPAKNIHPFYSRDIFDLYDPIYNSKGMLTGLLSNAYFEKLENGWIHCHIDNSAGTAEVTNASIRPRPLIDHPSDEWLYGTKGYTVMVEIRNNHSTQPSSGNFDMYTQQTSNTQFFGNGTIYSSSREGLVNTLMTINFKTIGENHILYGHVRPNVITTQFTDSNNPTYTELFRYNIRVGVGGILDCDMRFSIYEGYYDGEYIPYVEDQTYLNDQKARLDKTDPSNLLLLDDSPLIDISANNTTIKSRWWVMQVGNITNGTLEKTTNGVKFTRSTATGTYIIVPLKPNVSFVSGEDLTLSFDYKSNTAQCGQIILIRGNNASNPVQVTTPNAKQLEVSTNAWKHYEFTFPFQPVSSSVAGQWIPLVQFGFGLAASDSGKWIEFKDGTLKLEKGNTLTRINEAEKRSNVDISVVSINYGSNTATLKATLYIDGVATTTGVAYQWYKDGQIITGQTLQQLSVTSTMGLNHVYSCNVGY